MVCLSQSNHTDIFEYLFTAKSCATDELVISFWVGAI